MENVICFDNSNGATFYFNFNLQTFVLSDIADLSDFSFYTSENYCPIWVSEIALSEFKCSIEYLETHGIQVRHSELLCF